MELEYKENRIIFSKEQSKLDDLALLFSRKLSKFDINHAYLSGYIAILFGRNRASEDIDLVCETISEQEFNKLWTELHKDLECIITDNVDEAYNNYLKENTALRFSGKGELIPNIEMKFARTEHHRLAIDMSIIVELNNNTIPISPLEQQIAYKL